MNHSQVCLDTKHHDDGTVATEASTVLCEETKRVQFAETLYIQSIPGLDVYTSDEFAACWYSPNEFTKIEKRAMKECAKMERGKVLKDKKYCARGLENYRAFKNIASTENIRDAVESVLLEQDRQIENQEFHNDEAIAQVYHNVSSSCEMWAKVVGLRDQKDAERYIDDEEDKWEDGRSGMSQTSIAPSLVPKEKTPIVHSSRRPMPALQWVVAISARSA